MVRDKWGLCNVDTPKGNLTISKAKKSRKRPTLRVKTVRRTTCPTRGASSRGPRARRASTTRSCRDGRACCCPRPRSSATCTRQSVPRAATCPASERASPRSRPSARAHAPAYLYYVICSCANNERDIKTTSLDCIFYFCFGVFGKGLLWMALFGIVVGYRWNLTICPRIDKKLRRFLDESGYAWRLSCYLIVYCASFGHFRRELYNAYCERSNRIIQNWVCNCMQIRNMLLLFLIS